MDDRQKRREEIARYWETKSESGVTVYPMRAAVRAMENQGCDMSAAQPLLARGDELYRAEQYDELLVIIARINAVIHRAIEARGEYGPTTLAELRTMLPPELPQVSGKLSTAEYRDRVRGGWVGKCIGTALGDPVEGWTSEMIRSHYGKVTDYIVPPKIENDDTAYPILVLHALDEYGPSFTSEQLGLEWVEHLPYAFTAEMSALENIKAGIMPPESGRFRNPCSEWIGAQMRGEIHGLITPLRPDLAMDYALRDGIISHRREGIYAEVYCAALISLAFSEKSIPEILRLALSFVPPESRFYQVVEQTFHWCETIGEPTGVLKRIEQELGHYHWIHAFPNIATAITGLLLSEGDFERAITTTLMCGFDTDCSVGQVGALLGTHLGYERLPDKWKEPVGDEFESYVIGFERMRFDELTEWTARWGERIAGEVVRVE
ncbi:MAG: hypothetical protein DRN33_03045 [Thermoplasmata archaeon]|nr:MAG: hypothetical protein DRN33_03045 [Thermoplasmata archaeon]